MPRALFRDGERHGELSVFPHQLQHAAASRIFRDAHCELVHRLVQRFLRQLHLCKIMLRVHRNSPSAKACAEDQLGRAGFAGIM